MQIKDSFGKRIVCNHIFSLSEISSGSSWISANGTVATVLGTANGLITYQVDNVSYDTDTIAFQCKYCKIIT